MRQVMWISLPVINLFCNAEADGLLTDCVGVSLSSSSAESYESRLSNGYSKVVEMADSLNWIVNCWK